MKKIIVTICFAVTTLAGVAQCPVSFHAKAGIGSSYFWGKHSGSETQMAYKAGVGVEYALNRTWILKSALEFVSIGGKDEKEYAYKADMKELYLQIPLMMAARLNIGRNAHASLGAGPYVAVGIGGKTFGELFDYTSSSYPSPNYRFRMDTFGSMMEGNMGNNRFDAGIALGLTFEYSRFIIGAEAQVGFITVNKQLGQLLGSDAYDEYLPRNFASFFTIGYRFW